MAHFAHIADGRVTHIHVLANEVLTDDDGVEREHLGKAFLVELWGGSPDDYVQTSYNGNPVDDEDRGPYAGIGYAWDGTRFTAPPTPSVPEES